MDLLKENIKKVCPECGIELIGGSGGRKYCSRTCMFKNQGYRKNISIGLKTTKTGLRPRKICPLCKEVFTGGSTYCSTRCVCKTVRQFVKHPGLSSTKPILVHKNSEIKLVCKICNQICYGTYGLPSHVTKKHGLNYYEYRELYYGESFNRKCEVCGKEIPGVGAYYCSIDCRNNGRTWKQNIRNARMKQIMPLKDTSIEVKLQEELKKLNIKFEKHKSIFGQPDIFIDPNICIFCDGDYWHNYPNGNDRDKQVNDVLTRNGYTVLRFWERDIHQNSVDCVNQIKLCIRT